MSNLISGTNGSTGKSFFQKPENITGAIMICLLGFVGFKWGGQLLSGILDLGGFLLVAGVMAIIFGVIVTQWRYLTSLWKVAMYKLTDAIFSIDPIAIGWATLDKMKNKLEKIEVGIRKIGGAWANVKKQISDNNAEYDKNERTAKLLVSKGEDLNAKLCLNRNLRLSKWNEALLPLSQTMEVMTSGLKQLHEAASFVIADKTDELTILEKQYNSVKIGWAAVRQTQDIIGQSKDREDIEKSISMVNEDMTNKLSEMGRIMELAAPVLQEIDIEKGINDSKIQEMLDKLKTGEFDKALSSMTSDKSIAAGVSQTINLEPIKISVNSASSENKYTSLGI